MKEWIPFFGDLVPFFQELIWPLFIGVLIFLNRTSVMEFLATIRKRLEEGSEVKIGPDGIFVGQAPVLPENVNNSDIIDDGYRPKTEEEGASIKATFVSPEDKLSLAHRTSFWKMINGRAYFRIFITTLAENEELKTKIEKVVYHLHPTFKTPTRVVTTSENEFLLKTAGWGEFVTRADVYLEDVSSPVKLNRYIDLKA